jgi:hypothetical protein
MGIAGITGCGIIAGITGCGGLTGCGGIADITGCGGIAGITGRGGIDGIGAAVPSGYLASYTFSMGFPSGPRDTHEPGGASDGTGGSPSASSIFCPPAGIGMPMGIPPMGIPPMGMPPMGIPMGIPIGMPMGIPPMG